MTREQIRSEETKIKILSFLKSMSEGKILYSDGTAWVWATWFNSDVEEQFPNSVRNVLPEDLKDCTVRALMSTLDKQGLVEGCHCGCRGDYEITDQGLAYLENHS